MINITSASRNDATIKSFVCRTKCLTYKIQNSSLTLREKCPYLELFWSVFCPNAGIYGLEKLQIRTRFTQCKPLIHYVPKWSDTF